MGPEAEFEEYDRRGAWTMVYNNIRQESLMTHDYSLKDAKKAEFRGRNRYRDVSPYDHSRVCLKRGGIDYINASLVKSSAANRSYILAQGPLQNTAGHFWLMVWEQNSTAVLMLNRVIEMGRGPLPNTASHFWLMVWEQNSRAVLMLNRIIEKGQVKCHQYFPRGGENEGEDTLEFEDVGLRVRYLSEENANYYIIRRLEITDLESGEKKPVLQFHYTTWPDFGVPESPSAFLNFLMAVRKSGALEPDVGPPVIHCSAGIGRSGTFCLVDTCLVLIENNQDANCVNVVEILMDMRTFRMGLIQTPDQLRFSYLAIIEGSKSVLAPAISGFDDKSSSSGASATFPAELDSSNGGLAESEADRDFDDLSDSPPSTPPPLPPRANGPPALQRQAPIVEPTPPSPPAQLSAADDNNNPGRQGPRPTGPGPGDRTDRSDRSAPAVESEGVRQRFPDHDADVISGNGDLDELSEPLIRGDSVVRRRKREERVKNTAEQVARMKRKQQECERWKLQRQQLRPYAVGLSVAIALGSLFLYKYYLT